MRFRITLISVLLAGSVQAMEPGTYRPGQPYHSSKAGSAYACSAQCQSDNRCQSWNFVSVNRDAKYGVCEYNAQRVAPVSSPVSISGDSIAAGRTSTQMVSAGTRTLRVGSMPSRSSYPSALSGTSTTRRIVSQPMAPKVTPRPVHALDTLPQALQVSRVSTPARAFKHSLEAMPPQRAQQKPQYGLQQNAAVRIAPAQHPTGHTAQVPQQMTSIQMRSAPRQMSNVTETSVQASTAPMQRSLPVKNSLYGSLHDDVQVPKSLKAVPLDNEAPISTVSAVPTEKIMQDKLYGMAGPGRKN